MWVSEEWLRTRRDSGGGVGTGVSVIEGPFSSIESDGSVDSGILGDSSMSDFICTRYSPSIILHNS